MPPMYSIDGDTDVMDRAGAGDELVSPSRVRQHFPETWLWFERTLGYTKLSYM